MNVSQRPNDGEVIWNLSRAQPPEDGRGWLLTEEPLNRGADLAVVVSVTHDVLVDVTGAIATLALPIGRLAHARLADTGPDAVADGGHARWLADGLARQVRDLVVADPPRRLHLFAACPVGLMLLLGQRADAWAPSTVYEFGFEDGSRRYFFCWDGLRCGLTWLHCFNQIRKDREALPTPFGPEVRRSVE